jgi:hypothetical protein
VRHLGIDFGPRRFALPVVPANMKTVVDETIASHWPQRITST